MVDKVDVKTATARKARTSRNYKGINTLQIIVGGEVGVIISRPHVAVLTV